MLGFLISIHAPREGSDVNWYLRIVDQGGFQSTLPVRGATSRLTSYRLEQLISIHAPREGSDVVPMIPSLHLYISIHAPREGSDLPKHTSARKKTISIHAPREGSHLRLDAMRSSPARFQSTLPVRGATPLMTAQKST